MSPAPRERETRRHQALSPEATEKLAETLRAARMAKGWSREKLSVEAEEALRRRAGDFRSPLFATTETRQLWRSIEISSMDIYHMEKRPVLPLGRDHRRARLLGVCLALELDRALINEIAGGV